MSRKGNCYDNAPGTRFIESVPLSFLESFFKTLKVEEVYRGKFNTMKEVQYFLFDYIERYYNRKRRLGFRLPEPGRVSS
ncbi:IS3 family transposase [Leptospira alexanderi]|uniref:IS3 family transposase n=1 Tax=Leptospira alexanderi TaxID=100053 RepID=UPI000991152E